MGRAPVPTINPPPPPPPPGKKKKSPAFIYGKIWLESWNWIAIEFCELITSRVWYINSAITVIFDKHTLWFIAYSASFLFLKQSTIFNKACLLRSALAYQYPKMINFDAVEFTACCSKEVISFFWCSVYVKFYFIFISFIHFPCMQQHNIDIQ